MRKPLAIVLFLLAAVCSLFVSAATAQTPAVPILSGPVYDETGTLTPDQIQALTQKLLANEDSTSTQIVVVIMNTLNGYPPSDFATDIGNKNKLGEKKKNNGIVILLAKNDRKGFIATGYGVEPTVTDALAGQVFDQVLKPSLRQDDYFGGISKTIDALILASRGEFKGTPKRQKQNDDFGVGAWIFVIIFFVIVIIIRAAVGSGLRRTVVGSGGTSTGFLSGFLQALFWSSIFRGPRGRGRGGDFFGGFGGGSGGGGWSGGGGSFGGGGAGGDW